MNVCNLINQILVTCLNPRGKLRIQENRPLLRLKFRFWKLLYDRNIIIKILF